MGLDMSAGNSHLEKQGLPSAELPRLRVPSLAYYRGSECGFMGSLGRCAALHVGVSTARAKVQKDK